MLRNYCLNRGGLICGLILVGASLASAQERKGIEPRRGDERAGIQIRRVSSVIGTTVSVRGNASLGKIEDIVLNDDGCVDYLVVTYEEKFILVPWSAARVDFNRRTASVDIERDKFREVPTFTREKWPDFSNKQYMETIHKFYGVQPGTRGRGEEHREDKKDRRDKPPE
jgi:hypothetical protein